MFGAIIAVKQGSTFRPIDADLDAALAEIRVEQFLDEPTQFALRFQEDFEGDEPKLTKQTLFKTSTELVILVPDRPGSRRLRCLVRGIVEQVSFDIDTGGAGSAFEASGRDVLMMLAREDQSDSLDNMTIGLIVGTLLKADFDLLPCLAVGDVIYSSLAGGPAAFNAIGSPLEIIEDLAEIENKYVWLSYEVPNPLPPITVLTTLNVRSSPYRNEPLIGEPPIETPLDARPDIKLLIGIGERPNVINFRIDSDHERAKSVKAQAFGESASESTEIEGKSADDKMNPAANGVEDTGAEPGPLGAASEKPERSAQISGPGGPTEVAAKAEAMATEESWYIEAETMTSASLYGAVLQPHDKVKVTGAGCEWAGDYQVADVVHVINGEEHYMTATLRGNSRGKGTSL